MREVWLHTNRRFFASLAAWPVAGIVLCAVVLFRRQEWPPAGPWATLMLSVIVACIAALAVLAYLASKPRLAYEPGQLLVFTRPELPVRVPIEFVECFLYGQGPTFLRSRRLERAETRTIVIKLAEKAEDFEQLPIQPAIGSWCDGYITLRGTWCEPLSMEVVNRLNQRLAVAHRSRSESA